MPQPESAHRQTSSSSASGASRRRSVGCMAGLLRLLSPYHRSHHRKRLTAKNSMPVVCTPPPSPPPLKKRLPAAVAAPSPSPSPLPSSAQTQQQQPAPTAILRRRSCDAPRSPTIAPEHRRASCDSPRPTSPAIVARLMGLEESAPPSPALQATRRLPTRPPPPPPPPDTAAEKRRKLLGALEKCDEDLKTLRRIIAAVRAAEMRASTASEVPVPERAAGKGDDKSKDGRAVNPSPSPSPSPSPTAQKPRSEEQYPSPDSVLDAITSPRFPCRKRSSPCTDHDADHKPSGGISAVRSKIVKPSRTLVFSGDYCKIKPCNELHAVAMYHHPVVATVEAIPRWMPPAAAGEAEIIWRHRRRWGLEAAASGRSRAMAESVGEVWGQTAGEESREAARVGAALERAILHDLVGDAVAELLAHSMPPHPCRHGDVAAGAAAMCKKRLVFGAS
ncbi:hypothetical protein GUJ93_ZPchr0003g17099 [Zizania palustris]|uniref:DUF3741 domain-containing protein n=1 Tax=Zizania palustris TaxID=103762 RepID=A0A8J5VYF3_ZIZPA|nr:hypothetical protein GUJ93_ZPchr0003g17099 [Zizania palustris]